LGGDYRGGLNNEERRAKKQILYISTTAEAS